MSDQDELKHEAALLAAGYVAEGMVVGLGTGSTADFFLRELGARVRDGLKISGIPTSERSEARARELGIPLTSLDECDKIDVTVDGADEVDLGTFHVIKGRGGALLREKIVASATRLQVIIADESKLVQRLGERGTVPVEVIPFGWRQTAEELRELGADVALRGSQGAPARWPVQPHPEDAERPFVSDSGNFIVDCHWAEIADPVTLAARIKLLTGVVEHGMFISLVHRVVIAGGHGIQVYERGS